MAKKERKKIKSMIQTVLPQGQQSPTMQRTHLCPRCTHPLIKDTFTCPGCSLEFKDRKQAKKISIIYPGGGYFYTGHPFLGLADAVVELYFSILVFIALLDVIRGVTGSVPVLVSFAVILAVEKALTVYHSNHFINEYIPKDSRIQVISQALESPQPAAPPVEPKPEEILSASWR